MLSAALSIKPTAPCCVQGLALFLQSAALCLDAGAMVIPGDMGDRTFRLLLAVSEAWCCCRQGPQLLLAQLLLAVRARRAVGSLLGLLLLRSVTRAMPPLSAAALHPALARWSRASVYAGDPFCP